MISHIIKILMLYSLLLSLKCDDNSDNTTISFQGYNITTNCTESNPASICITKPACCHITNNYKSFSYSACVDIKDPKNSIIFCRNFIKINKEKGYNAAECICNNYEYLYENIIHPSYIILILLLIQLF
jgi:hypothetical protein